MSHTPAILIIDDDKSVFKLIEMALTKMDVQCVFAENAVHGLRLIDDVQPDLIIMDLLLPEGVKGWDAIQMLKSQEATHQIPILVLTAGNSQHIARAMTAGAQDCITKPFVVREFQALVASYLAAMHK